MQFMQEPLSFCDKGSSIYAYFGAVTAGKGKGKKGGTSLIEIKQLTKYYGKGSQQNIALSNLDLTIEKGEIFGVIGHSGAGKSTLIRCVNLLERPSSGEVWVGGVNLTALPRNQLQLARRKISMIFQHFNLLSSATVYENVAFPCDWFTLLRLSWMPK